ncbi:MAG: sigma-70 family RNA polymerase sigma factor [Aphanocapsa lilacina HA4352-LM1]|nr:sigma-70 family RNA polymerase sigma factor [Aphanocapsa lilacina HA4352-LM1]
MPPKEVTTLLHEWSGGDRQALAALTPLVYDELHKLAIHYVRQERADHTLQPTALISEAYLKMLGQKHVPQFRDRAHFLAVAANNMRHILVDHARARLTAKRGGGLVKVPLETVGELANPVEVEPDPDERLIALDAALKRLAELDPLKSQIVEMRHFGEMKVEEVAEVLGVGESTVKRHWKLACAWLAREIGSRA